MATKDMTINHASDALMEDTIQNRAQAKLQRLIVTQGVRPLTLDDLHAMDDLWPEDESVDGFISAVRQWRREGKERRRMIAEIHPDDGSYSF
jgi:hypothetical protein